MPRSPHGRAVAVAALAGLVLALAAPPTAAPALRVLDALERARVVSLAPAPAAGAAATALEGPVELAIPADAAWAPVPAGRAAAIGAPEGVALWHLDVLLPIAEAESVALSLGGRALPVWRRGTAKPVVPGFFYQPGGFVPAGLYVALEAGQGPRGIVGTVRFAPTAAERARRLAAAGGMPDPAALASVVERRHVARPALLVPAGTALEVSLTPPAGARLHTALARAAAPLAAAAGSETTLRLGVVATGVPTWLVERRFADPPAPGDDWLPLEADLSPWAGKPVALRIELAAADPGAAPLHFLADPEVRGPPAGSARPNLLLLVIDGLRADRIAAEHTPHLMRLASTGLHFRQARAPAPWTRPSIASLFTGVPPARHGVVTEAPDAVLPADLPTLASVLRAAGHATAAFSANLHLAPPFGLARGFSLARVVHEDGAKLRDALLTHLERDPPEPWFAFAFLMDTHHPFRHRPEFDRSSAIAAPLRNAAELGASRDRGARGVPEPTPDEVRKLSALYEENVRYADARVGELLDALAARGELARTLVVVVADHGEAFGEHGSFFHGHDLHDDVLRVPLLVAGPGVPAGVVRDDPVSLVDLPATLLAWLDVAPGALPGRDLRTPCAGGESACAQLFETRFRGADQAALLAPPFKLIVDRRLGREQLFDLAADPGEGNDLAAAQPERVRALAGLLQQRIADAGAAAPAGPQPAKPAPALDPATVEALRALGYVSE
jgi:arylsulfatase A-like enzyme